LDPAGSDPDPPNSPDIRPLRCTPSMGSCTLDTFINIEFWQAGWSILYNQDAEPEKQESSADTRVTRDSAVIPGLRLFQDGRQPPSWILSNRI